MPATMRIPTGVRTPLVDIMSMRARAGAVHALVQPGERLASSSFATSSDSRLAASARARRDRARA